MPNRNADVAQAIFGLAVVLLFALATFHAWRDCKQRGGALVHGAIWWSCVATPAP